MADQPVTVHKKLVALGLAAENRMIVEHEAGFSRPGLALKDQRRSQTADASANHQAVVSLFRVDHICGEPLKYAVANLVSSFEHGGCVAVGIRVVADTGVTGPVIDRRTCDPIR